MFDPLLHARALSPRALADLAFFGVEGALVPSDDTVPSATPAAIRKGWEAVAASARRLRRAGLAGYAALGLHPRRIPLRGLEALLAELPEALGRPEVAAIGAVGLHEGGELEERVLLRQLELARELRLPVVIQVPWRARERMTRRLLALLKEAETPPRQALLAGADARTVRGIVACGQLAGIALSGGAGAARAGDAPRAQIDQAVAIVRSLGAEGIVLGSDAGLSGGDLLALPRAADRLARAGLGKAVIRRVCGGNALAFLRADPAALRRGASDRSARPPSP